MTNSERAGIARQVDSAMPAERARQQREAMRIAAMLAVPTLRALAGV